MLVKEWWPWMCCQRHSCGAAIRNPANERASLTHARAERPPCEASWKVWNVAKAPAAGSESNANHLPCSHAATLAKYHVHSARMRHHFQAGALAASRALTPWADARSAKYALTRPRRSLAKGDCSAPQSKAPASPGGPAAAQAASARGKSSTAPTTHRFRHCSTAEAADNACTEWKRTVASRPSASASTARPPGWPCAPRAATRSRSSTWRSTTVQRAGRAPLEDFATLACSAFAACAGVSTTLSDPPRRSMRQRSFGVTKKPWPSMAAS
mmetsp:Transcript_103452/g.316673  ORF Transcript_103452/g.316673 Transcript_103452/m.316673 type:complete len:270 (+) Transcript_103452:658-1467(+)